MRSTLITLSLLLFYSCFGQYQFSELWKTSFNYTVDSDPSEYTEVQKLDPAGNLVIGAVGSSVPFVCKIDSAGNLLWRTTLNGNSNQGGMVFGMDIDPTGNIYFAASLNNRGTSDDIFTAKLDPNGSILWYRNHFVATGVWGDQPREIKVGRDGNIYVSGYQNNSVNTDGCVLKYDPNGNLIWAAAVLLPTGDITYSTDLDQNGQVYAGGKTYTAVVNSFNNNGVFLWDTLLPGSVSNVVYKIITLDSLNTIAFAEIQNTGTNVDIRVVSYRNSGLINWTYNFTGIGTDDNYFIAGEVAGNGNIYFLTRDSQNPGGNKGYTLLCLNSSGVYQWETNVLNNMEYPRGLSFDPNFNPVISLATSLSGFDKDFAIRKYNKTNGSLLWNTPFAFSANYHDDPESCLTDANGFNYTAGFTATTSNSVTNLCVIKTGINGNIIWTNTYNFNLNKLDNLVDAVYDPNGAIITTGSIESSATGKDLVTIKFDTLGNQLWYRTYGSPTTFNESSAAAFADQFGNVYVTGYIIPDTTYRALILLKYDPSGNLVWTAQYSAPTLLGDEGMDVISDAQGNTYVAGKSKSLSATHNDWLVIKFDPSGSFLWSDTYTSPSSYDDEAKLIKFDPLGNIIVAGTFYTNPGASDVLLRSYSPSGSINWTSTFSSPNIESDLVNDLHVHTDGSIYITGRYGLFSDIFTARFSPVGTLLWTSISSGPNYYDQGFAIDVDPAGAAYVTGMHSNGTIGQIVVLKYDSTGNLRWNWQYGRTSTLDAGHDLVVQDGILYVTCRYVHPVSYTDYFTLAFDTAGNLLDSIKFDQLFCTDEIPYRLLADQNGGIYVAGNGQNERSYDQFVLKYKLCNNPVSTSGVISGPSLVCIGLNTYIYTVPLVPNATTYQWIVPQFATLLSGQGSNSITVNFNMANTGVIQVTASNACSMAPPSSFSVVSGLCTDQSMISDRDNRPILYPNPCDEVLHVDRIPTSESSFVLEVFNLMGQLAYSGIIHSSNISLNTQLFQAGWYMLKISNETNTFSIPFSKIK